MNLRTRIALFVGIATLLLSLIFVTQVIVSVHVTHESARRDTQTLIEEIWSGYVADVAKEQDFTASRARHDVELLNALARADRRVIEARLRQMAAEGQELIIVDAALKTIYHVADARPPYGFLQDLQSMKRAVETNGFTRFRLRGSTEIYHAKLVPLRFRFGIVGYAIVTTSISHVIDRFNASVDLNARLVETDSAALTADQAIPVAEAVAIPLMDSFRTGLPLGYVGVTGDRSADLQRARWLQWLLGGLVVVFVGHVLGSLIWMVRGAFRPLDAAIDVINKLTRGEEAPPLSTEKGTIEIQRLSEAVEALRTAHKVQESLRQIQAELTVASELQQALLPREPLLLGNVSVYGQMIPSQEMAGDYFDYFLIDDTWVGFLIADVCGKGTPAALFMAMSRTVVRSLAMTGRAPGDVLAEANRVLAASNDKNLFVTLFYGVINRFTGELKYANAGHVPPILKKAGGEAAYLTHTGDLVLGIIPDIDYRTVETSVAPGSLIICYTDGITDAFNAAQEQFGDARFLHLVVQENNVPEALIEQYRRAVTSFAAGVPQYDDITLCLCAFGNVDGQVESVQRS